VATIVNGSDKSGQPLLSCPPPAYVEQLATKNSNPYSLSRSPHQAVASASRTIVALWTALSSAAAANPGILRLSRVCLANSAHKPLTDITPRITHSPQNGDNCHCHKRHCSVDKCSSLRK